MLRILALLCLSLAVSAATIDVTSVGTVPATAVSVTTATAQTLVFTNNGIQDRAVSVMIDQAWGWAAADGAFATKYPLGVSQAYTFAVPPGGMTIYVQASTTTGNLHAAVVSAIKQ